jgi:hypothetical protein
MAIGGEECLTRFLRQIFIPLDPPLSALASKTDLYRRIANPHDRVKSVHFGAVMEVVPAKGTAHLVLRWDPLCYDVLEPVAREGHDHRLGLVQIAAKPRYGCDGGS